MGRLSQNTLWNLLGNGLPLLVGLATIPALLDGLGVERFGLLTLIWATLGYFSLFDLGLGRATTHIVARYSSTGDSARTSHALQVSFLALGTIGLIFFFIFWASMNVVQDVFGISDALEPGEGLRSFWVVAASMPVILVTAGARGALEGQGRFRTANLIKLPASVLVFVLPLVVLQFTVRLDMIALVLGLSRFVFMVIYITSVRGVLRAASIPAWDDALALLKQMFAYGAWIFVAVSFGTLMSMGYLDRLLIGGLMSVADISYYAVPMEIILRAMIIPGALAAALFPFFSASMVTGLDVSELCRQALRTINLVILPLLLVVLVVGEESLSWWINAEFASHSYSALCLLIIGLLFNSLAHIPYTLLQAAGHPNVTALRHVAELPFYLLLLWAMIQWLGVNGAALTWMIWAIGDMWLLFWLASRANIKMSLEGRDLGLICAVVLAGYAVTWLPSMNAKMGGLILLGMTYFTVSWKWYLTETQRNRFIRVVKPYSAM